MDGFGFLEKLRQIDLPLKEGTLYPLLSRMTEEGTLNAAWETQNLKGHPRKFYFLTEDGRKLLEAMSAEFDSMVKLYQRLQFHKEVRVADSNCSS